MQIAFIGVPIALGADRNGVELAPDYFRNKGIVKMLHNIAGCYDLGNVQSSIIAEQKYSANPEVKYLDTVVDVTTQLRDKVDSVIHQGFFPLVIGGDHSLGLGSVAGAALACDNIGVIWFDAHGDFNTEETSPSGNLHGMPCAALMGWCKSCLSKVATKQIPPQNFFWIGARDLDPGEVEFAQKYNLHIYTVDMVKENGMKAIMKKITDNLEEQSINKVHLSIDIDGMDPSIICGTGTKVNGGLDNGHFYTFVDSIFATNKVVSADLVEYNNLLDDDDETTAKWCVEALHYIGVKINHINHDCSCMNKL
jgi:arginase